MSNRVVKVVVIVAALLAACTVGAVAGGGVVYLLTRDRGASSAFEVHLPADDGSIVKVDAEPGAVVLVGVTAGGPADQAGLRAGDVVSAVDGRSLSLEYDLRDA
ncbi:MAG: PDZ domain-containing protein, partial [Anaerolineae bacterium]|nr:PDZ domain-containing protein [Anaerolineae bacterium]